MEENGGRGIVELGEHEIIRIIQGYLTLPKMPVPFGDDVSAVELDSTRVAVLKTDMLVGKTDVPEQMSLYQAARKAIVMNVSDFASKGVQPIAALVALGLPGRFAQKDIEAIAQGLNDGAREYNAYVIGGDTSETSDLIISISLFGYSEKSSVMLRSGAKPGDILAVTGSFGKPPSGLQLMYGDFTAPKDAKTLLNSVLLPKARLTEGLALARSGAVTASMDSSDGLSWSVHEIGRLSNIGFILDQVPIAEEAAEFARINDLDAEELALYGGEEYELVLTIKPEKWAVAEESVTAVGGKLIKIGRATKEKEVVLTIKGRKRTLNARGWEHFKSQL